MAARSTIIAFVFCVFIQETHLTTSVSSVTDSSNNASTLSFSSISDSTLALVSPTKATSVSESAPTAAESTSSTTTAATSSSTTTTSTSTTTTTTTAMPTTPTTITTTPMPTTTAPEPPQPTNLMVVSKSVDSFNITWQSTGNTSCDVMYTNPGSSSNISSCTDVTNMMCTISSLAPGTSYSISVISRLGSKTSSSLPLIAITKPNMTSACRTSDVTESSMTLSWPAAISNLTVTYFYNYTTNLYNTSVSSTVVLGLSPGSNYSFKVWASVSDTVSDAVYCSGTTVPLVSVSKCSSSQEMSSNLNLSWQAALATLPLSYLILYDPNGTKQIDSPGNSTPINNLVPGTIYNFTILVFITGSPNLRSRTNITCPGSTGPATATDISVSGITSTSLVITWNVGNTNKIDSSIVNYSCGSKNNSTSSNSSNSANLQGLQPGCNYSLCVVVTSYSKTASSCVWNVTNPSLSGTCNFSNVTLKSMSVSWSNASSVLAVDYPVSYSSSDTSVSTTAVTPALVLADLTPGTLYSFHISARINTYQAAQSSSSLQCSKPTEPDIPAIKNITTTWSSLNLTWSVGNTKTVNRTIVNYTCNATTASREIITGSQELLSGLKSGCNYAVCVVIQSYGNEASSCESAITNPYINDSCFCPEQQRTNSSLNVTWPSAQSTMSVTYYLTNAYSNFQKFTNATSFLVTNLKAGESYTFSVLAQLQESSDKQSPPVFCTCHTVPNTPSGLTVQALNETSFRASWIKDLNASQISYNVTYSKYGENQIRLASCDSTLSDCVITVSNADLAGSSYNVCLSSISNMVHSPEECQCVTTYPYSPTNVTTTTNDTSVTVTIIPNPRNIKPTEMCYIASLTNSGGFYYNLTSKADLEKTVIPFGGLKPASDYSFFVKSSVRGSCSLGSSAVCDHESLTYFSGRVTTEEARPSEVQNLSVVGDSRAGSVSLSWVAPAAPNGVLQYYYVLVTRLPKTSGGNADLEVQKEFPFKASLPNDMHQYNITGLRAGYNYTIQVFASTKVGNGTETKIQYLTKQNYPVLIQSKNFTLHQLDDRAVSFQQLTASVSNVFSGITGDIVNYTVIVTTDPTFSTSTNIKSILGKQHPEAYAAKVRKEFFCTSTNNDCSFVIGTGADCDSLVCDAQLKPETTYYFFIVACNSEYCTGSPISQSGKTDKNWPLLIMQICVGVIVPVAVVIIIILVIFIVCYIRKKGVPRRTTTNARASTAIPTNGNSELESSCIGKPIPIEKFLERVAELERDSGLLFSDEYEELKPVGKEQSCSSSELEQNRTKNRYGNIKPYDITRVKLLPVEDEEGSDYINANWMPGFNSKREFIAAQGPLPCTRDDFWRMIWEYNCRGIVMLTGCVEGGKIKCDQYWPHDMESVVYGDLQVTKTKEETTSQWVVRDLTICMGQQQRNISQIHLPNFEDNTAPQNLGDFLQFVRFVREKLAKRGGPVVVHCSAGVGRTGTFIATDTLLQQLDRQNFLDVFEVVYKLRLNRVLMVQTEAQYISLYRCLAHEIENRSPPAEEETTEDMYANFNGGPEKREDDIYANANSLQNNKEMIEMNGNFYHTGPESSIGSISRQ